MGLGRIIGKIVRVKSRSVEMGAPGYRGMRGVILVMMGGLSFILGILGKRVWL